MTSDTGVMGVGYEVLEEEIRQGRICPEDQISVGNNLYRLESYSGTIIQLDPETREPVGLPTDLEKGIGKANWALKID
jgi:hypothetical protein